jgi:hypothetical protein
MIYKKIIYMTRKEFIKYLNDNNIEYGLWGGSNIIEIRDRLNDDGASDPDGIDVEMNDIVSLPPDVRFNNSGDVYLNGVVNLSSTWFVNRGSVLMGSLKTLTSDVYFSNSFSVSLGSLETLPSNIIFSNRGDLVLKSLRELPPDVEFINNQRIYLHKIKTIPSSFQFKHPGDVYCPLIFGYISKWKGNISGISPLRLLNFMISKGFFV